ncbi:MAG: NAD(P)H-hydrate dehydratase [Actinobacteria bacterium]|nr:NAD(P)H-hydrate dehydratase [Actinomycetota bacterium]
MFAPLATAGEVRAAEEAYDGSLDELMERAGAAVAQVVLGRFPGSVAVVCGHGNNGGDGKVCARVLGAAGRDVTVVEGFGELGDPDVIVDALFGIGLKDAPREDAARMIERVNASGKPVVAIDIASGVDASSGEIPGAVVRAEVTVTFGSAKVGHLVSPGRGACGQIHVADIGLDVPGTEHRLVQARILDTVPAKAPSSTKYRAGAVLVVGGSRGMIGAPVLTAKAAFRADAGYVLLAAPESALPTLESLILEAVKVPLPEDSLGRLVPRAADSILEAATRADAVAIGPGLGRSEGTRELVRVLLENLTVPVVLDADALFDLDPFERRAPTILTPHAGELARLLGTDTDDIEAHRLEAVRRAAVRFGSTVLLKGPDTLVATPREGVLVCGFGRASLATAGSGDVLTGIVASFAAKGLEPSLAAAAAATAHGLASQLVEPQRGVVASDLLHGIRLALAGAGAGISPV